MLLVIPFLSFVIGLLSGHVAMRAGRVGRVLNFAGGLVCIGVWAIWREGAAAGMDVLIPLLVLWMAALPVALGLGLGTVLGLIERRGWAQPCEI